MKKFKSYNEAEEWVINEIIGEPDHITPTTRERFNLSFALINPRNNKNRRSDYEYAEEFFQWILSGERQLSSRLLELNPWVQRFVDTKNLPQDFSASYAWKIKDQLPTMITELCRDHYSRRAYMNILYPNDQVILKTKTTHEFPCTIGLQFLIRDGLLDMIVNMRSNNALSVMPYDVYNFTSLQIHFAKLFPFTLGVGMYYHQINNAHLYLGDVRRIEEGKIIF